MRYFTLTLANDGSLYDADHKGDTATLENDIPESATLINEVVIDDRGWALIPYGDWPHEMGMQKFHREQAAEIANSFNNIAGRFRRAIVGLPIFKGHPDHPVAAIANQYPDKDEKGQIAAVEVRDNGLALKLILSNAGADLVRKGWKFISPMWIGQLISKAGEAFRTYAPTELRSVGLVVKPNIPSPSLANAGKPANQNNKITSMNPETLKLLGLANDATPEQIDAAVKALKDKEGALANEQTALATTKGELTALQGKVTTLENAAKESVTKLTETQTALANERKARITDHIAVAIRQGRMTEAEKPTWEKRLEANFETEATVLANAAPKVKTESEIPAMLKTLESQMRKGLANEHGEPDGDENGKDACGMGNADYAKLKPEEKSAKMKALINEAFSAAEHLPETQRYNAAFANAKKANPRLFGLKINPNAA